MTMRFTAHFKSNSVFFFHRCSHKASPLVLPNADIPRASICLWGKYVTSKLECLPESKPDPLWPQFREDPEGRQESCAVNKNPTQQPSFCVKNRLYLTNSVPHRL